MSRVLYIRFAKAEQCLNTAYLFIRFLGMKATANEMAESRLETA